VAGGVQSAGFAGRGAVIQQGVPLRSAPRGAEQLDLEPGRLVEYREGSRGWVHVGLGGGLAGWVPAGSLERVVGGGAPRH